MDTETIQPIRRNGINHLKNSNISIKNPQH
ncbi:MAG: hypothetical protein ACJA1H_002411 [Glaciecola sp.]|jgi:hypothetical protein